MYTYKFYIDNLRHKSLKDITKMLKNNEITSLQLVWAYLEHMSRQDTAGACLNSIREFNPDAFDLAEYRDWQRNKGEILGSLHGIPIILKDCIDTADKMHTTCGAVIMKDHYAKKDAFIVEKLRKAGAIIIAKANMSEWYGMMSTKSPNGYSAIAKGSMKNPFGNNLIPGGSSGGCAVAVSADFASCAIGTETSGSIIEPAYMNGVVGFKPTVGLVSRSGILPVMNCQDVPGPITKSVYDAAILTNVIFGFDINDPSTHICYDLNNIDFTKDLEKANLIGKRFGILRESYFDDLSEESRKITEKAFEILKENGAVLIDVYDFMPAKLRLEPEKYEQLTSTSMKHSFKARFNHYLSQTDDIPAKTLSEIISWNKAHPYAIPYGQDYFEEIDNIKQPFITDNYFNERQKDIYICGENGVDGALNKYNLDALIMPGLKGQGIAPRNGNPIITIPCGKGDDGPVGLNLIGHVMGDHSLLKLAYACENVLPKRPLINY